MNACIETADRPTPAAADDAALIAQCKLAIRASERELAAMKVRGDLDDFYYASLPPYPTLPWMLGAIAIPGGLAPPAYRYSASELQAILEELGEEAGPAWCQKVQAQLKAVVAWEKDCAALRKSGGLTKAERRCASARARVLDLVRPVSGMAACTLEGAALKATALALWLDANVAIDGDLGEALVKSVVDDSRRLGLAKANRPITCRRAA